MGIPILLATSNVDWGGSTDAGKIVLTDSSGNIISPLDAASISLDRGGSLQGGRDYKIARTIRSTADGALQTADETLLLSDMVEGAAYNSNTWIQSLTTQTMTQATGVITFNASAITTTTTGSMLLSHRFLPYLFRNSLAFRCRLRYSAQAVNTVIEVGFGSPATVTTASIGNGAVWRKISAGDWQPFVSVNGTEIPGVAVTDATYRASVAVGEYAMHYVFLEDMKCTFQIVNQLGVLVNKQVIDWGTGTGTPTFATTHLQAIERLYFSGAAGSALQLLISGTSVYATDANQAKDLRTVQAGGCFGSLTSPTTYLQLANYANSAAPASATLSNTAAGYTTLGGQFQWVAVNGAETDFALFGFTNPSPYTLYITRVKISTWNTVVAAGAAITLLQWGLGFNSSAVSLATAAPYTPMRKTIGSQQLVGAGAVGAMFTPDVQWDGLEAVQPGRFFHVILKSQLSVATATEILRGVCEVGGYFE